MCSCNLTDDGVSGLVGLPKLANLDLSFCQKLTSKALESLMGLPLTALDVISCDGIKEEDLQPLKEAGVQVVGPDFDVQEYRRFVNLFKKS